MDKLSPKQKAIVTLFHKGLSSTKIAKRVGITPVAVLNSLQRMRRQGVDLPYRRPRADSVVPSQGPLFRFNQKTASFKKVTAIASHRPILTLLGHLRTKIDQIEKMLRVP